MLEATAPELRVSAGQRVLDYGCAEVPYRGWFPAEIEYLAADLPGNPDANVELVANGAVPLADGSVDAVLSTQVLEHVEDPALHLSECSRVLRPGGRLLLSTHGMMIYHPDPDDYWRWTCAGIKREVERAGLEIVGFRGIMGLAATGIQFFQAAIYSRLPRSLKRPFAFCMQALVALADRFEGEEAKRVNALVFVVLAEKR